MPVKKVYIKDQDKVFYQRNNLDDLLDIKRFPWAKFSSYKELFNLSSERQAKQKAKELFTEFLVLMSKDVIDEHNIYLLPRKDFGRILIARKRKEEYSIEDGGFKISEKICINPVYRLYNKKRYRMRFTRPLRTRLYLRQLQGDTY